MYIIYWKLRIEYFLTPVLNKMSAKTLCLSNNKKGKKKTTGPPQHSIFTPNKWCLAKRILCCLGVATSRPQSDFSCFRVQARISVCIDVSEETQDMLIIPVCVLNTHISLSARVCLVYIKTSLRANLCKTVWYPHMLLNSCFHHKPFNTA